MFFLLKIQLSMSTVELYRHTLLLPLILSTLVLFIYCYYLIIIYNTQVQSIHLMNYFEFSLIQTYTIQD